MKNIPNLFENQMVYGSSKNLLEDMIENNPRVFNPKNVDELKELQNGVVMMKNFADDYTEDEDKRLEGICVLPFSQYTTILTKSIQLKTKNP